VVINHLCLIFSVVCIFCIPNWNIVHIRVRKIASECQKSSRSQLGQRHFPVGVRTRDMVILWCELCRNWHVKLMLTSTTTTEAGEIETTAAGRAPSSLTPAPSCRIDITPNTDLRRTLHCVHIELYLSTRTEYDK